MLDPRVAIPDAVAITACALALAGDLRTRRIPNRLTVTAAACGLILNLALGGVHGLLLALGGGAVGLVVFGVPAGFGFVGMGDVKLVIALGALVRWPLALPLVLYAALAGGVVALGYAIQHGRLRAVARNLARLDTSVRHRMPYGLAIAIGCTWAVASRYVDALRLL